MKVFLSSVFRGLEQVRAKVRDQLLSLGYTVWWAEDDKRLRNARPEIVRAICLAALDSCDFYLGIFPARYGSDPLGVAFTEMEYHHAVSLALPRMLYRLQDHQLVSSDQRLKQSAFFTLLFDRDISMPTPTLIRSKKALLEQIPSDFGNASILPSRSQASPWNIPVLESLVTNSASASGILTSGNPSTSHAATLLAAESKRSLPRAQVTGLALLADLMRQSTSFVRSDLRRLDDFLVSWIYVAAWTGIKGPLGQTAAAKARIVLHQLLGDPAGIYRLAGGVSSGYYSDRRIPLARRWANVSLRTGHESNLLGSIALAEGNIPVAKTEFFNVITKPSNSADNFALHLGYYGLCSVREGNARQGLHDIDVALSTNQLDPTTTTRIFRTKASALLFVNAKKEAAAAAREALLIAKSHGLVGQERKASNLLQNFSHSAAGSHSPTLSPLTMPAGGTPSRASKGCP